LSDLVIATAGEIAGARLRGGLSTADVLRPFRSRFETYESDVLALVDRQYLAVPQVDRPAYGPLAGVPVTIKDVIDTADMPTQHGSPIYDGHRPASDARVVERIRAAGATIVGKAVTAEFAIRTPRETRNPHDFSRTPGGSSSGSAASVAAGFATLSIGTQTTASTVRPASFCGVFGMKPTHGTVSLDGVFIHSHTMDTIGIFARHALDLHTMLEVIANDRSLRAMRMREVHAAPRGSRVRLGLLRVPDWSGLDAAAAQVMEDALVQLEAGFELAEVSAPGVMHEAWTAQPIVHHSETAANLAAVHRDHRELLSPQLIELIETGQRELQDGYWEAIDVLRAASAQTGALFAEADFLLMPCAAGAAPEGLARSGGAEFGRFASATGLPAIAVPGLRVGGLPFGLQVIGPHHSDLALVEVARMVAEAVGYSPGVLPRMTPALH